MRDGDGNSGCGPLQASGPGTDIPLSRVVHVRPVRSSDADAMLAMHERLSAETIRRRFLFPLVRPSPALLTRLTTVDHSDRVGLVAEIGGTLVATARYDRIAGRHGDAAEVAFVVEDAHQGRGIGGLLLGHLALAARANGIRYFHAETEPGNRRMISLLQRAGPTSQRGAGKGTVEITCMLAEPA